MSPTWRFWRSMSWLVMRAAATDTANLSSRLIGFAVRSANALSRAISALIDAFLS